MDSLIDEHVRYTRRYFSALLGAGSIAALAPGCAHRLRPTRDARTTDYLTAQEMFGTVERGRPLPYTLEPDALAKAGLTPETWRLEIVADPDDPAVVDNELSLANGNAFTYDDLKRHARRNSVRFIKTLTCANGAKPLGTGLWEGVPLRDIIEHVGVRKSFRRMWYHGFHHRDPKQMFRSSLPADRLFEDPLETPPIILAYRLNGEPLSGKRGGPVRLIVPESYGFKNIKWLNRILLSNRPESNDTYAKYGNTTESWMKTLARFASKSDVVAAGTSLPLSGIAQVGTSGLDRAQILIKRGTIEADDTHFRDDRGWKDADLLPPPRDDWGGRLPAGQRPAGGGGVATAYGFSRDSGRPKMWPLRFSSCHWATVVEGLRPGSYTAFCRTIDMNGEPQPWPRLLQNSGRNLLHRIRFKVA